MESPDTAPWHPQERLAPPLSSARLPGLLACWRADQVSENANAGSGSDPDPEMVDFSREESLRLRMHLLAVSAPDEARLVEWEPELERGALNRIRASQKDLRHSNCESQPNMDDMPTDIFARANRAIRHADDSDALAYVQHLLLAGYNIDWREEYTDYDGGETHWIYRNTLAHTAAQYDKPACLAQLLLAGVDLRKTAGGGDYDEDDTRTVEQLAGGVCSRVLKETRRQWELRVAHAEEVRLRIPRALLFWIAQLARRHGLPEDVAARLFTLTFL